MIFPKNPKQGDLVTEDDGLTTWMWNESENFADHRPSQWVLVYRPDKTDDEVRQLMDLACSGGRGTDGEPPQHGAGYYMREFAEEVVAVRQRIAQLEREIKRYGEEIIDTRRRLAQLERR